MTAITDLAAFCEAARHAAVAQRDQLAWHLADTIGAMIAAMRTPEGAALIRMRAPVLVGRRRADVTTLCALTRMSEIDDIHLASMTTPGSIVIPAALAIAAACRARIPQRSLMP